MCFGKNDAMNESCTANRQLLPRQAAEREYISVVLWCGQAGLKPKPKIGIWHAGGAAKDTGYLRERAFDRGAMSTATEAILKVILSQRHPTNEHQTATGCCLR